ncbi:GntR family transcriptional regulator [Microlunatus soli]|uniref:Regulatory protein, tetR family n=1 Tax=Microlunatus soli TaxID=630515 RepID=A0A1H2A5H6_9ACTN|nr:GntR family transcriptional regulator [Microlunatus soli]SDT41042.1 regulatory protein, tetR family [Microlunatus soli]
MADRSAQHDRSQVAPYRRIVAELRGRILSGDLKPGDRLPSIRQIAQRWGVAAATATRVTGALRDEGLVLTAVGSGTTVAPAAADQPKAAPRGTVTRAAILQNAMIIADQEGLQAVSMRRLAAQLGVGPMSLYRHLSGKEELVAQLADDVFGSEPLPAHSRNGWRSDLERICRVQWGLCRRHPWLPRAISFTRPLMTPNVMAHTEWTLATLEGLGLSATDQVRESLVLPALVLDLAAQQTDDLDAELETGLTRDHWRTANREQISALLGGGRFPFLARISDGLAADLDGLFEYALARHLDGLAVLIGDEPG